MQSRLVSVLTYEEKSSDGESASKIDSSEVSASAVAQLPDFSHVLPADYRKNYMAWRSGQPKGAKGELLDAVEEMAKMHDSMLNNTSDDFTEVSVFRSGYANWRRGSVSGAKGSIHSLSNAFL